MHCGDDVTCLNGIAGNDVLLNHSALLTLSLTDSLGQRHWN